MTIEHLPHNLRLLRLRQGWTQIELARRADCRHTAICQYEKGRSEPVLSRAIRLAKALDVSLDALCGERLPPC